MANTLVGRGGGRGGWDLKWYYDTLTPSRAKFAAKMAIATNELMEEMAQVIQEHMQTNAPWSDRTGEARQGLTAEAGQEGTNFVITLYHTVSYGIWLEVRWSGRYAIILPTLELMGPQLMARLQNMMGVMSIL